jgi:hypothetical protein
MIEVVCSLLALTVVACMVYCYRCERKIKRLKTRIYLNRLTHNLQTDLINRGNQKISSMERENQLLKLELMRLDPTEPLKDFTLFNLNETKPNP